MRHSSGSLLIKKTTDFNLAQKGSTVFVNNYSFMLLVKSENELIYKFDNVHADGFFLVYLLNIFTKKKIKRYSFDYTSVAKLLFQNCTAQDNYIFIGTTEDSMTKAVKAIKTDYPNLNIVYYRNGYFTDDQEIDECIRLVKQKSATHVIVGMGTPRQEYFLTRLVEAGIHSKLYTCGGFFHQIAESGLEYYPKLINDFNLRWVYRIYKEPKLFWRYFWEYPKSLSTIIASIVRYNIDTWEK